MRHRLLMLLTVLDYTKSSWYIQAEKETKGFWSEPYYYYDGTSISGHYCTYVVWFVIGRYAKNS